MFWMVFVESRTSSITSEELSPGKSKLELRRACSSNNFHALKSRKNRIRSFFVENGELFRGRKRKPFRDLPESTGVKSPTSQIGNLQFFTRLGLGDDLVLRYQLIYAVGSPLPLPQGPDRWTAAASLLRILQKSQRHWVASRLALACWS